MADKTDFYQRLNIQTGASDDAIRKAYRLAVKKAHPDVNKQTGATEMFLGIQEAYQILSDPNKRQDYDQGREPSQTPGAIHITTQYSSESLYHYAEPQIAYCMIDFVTPEAVKDTANLPINIALVLDTSTSMKGDRLDLLKSATKEIIEDLHEQDAVSIISFNDRSRVLLPNQTHPPAVQVEASLNSLLAEGGTEIFQGLEAAFNQINTRITDDHVNHIILITDGHTYGDEEKCFELARAAANQEIGISSLGIGVEWNDEFIDELCGITGGTSMFIRKPPEVKKFLKKTIETLKDSSARQVSLFLHPAPGVRTLSAFRILPETFPLPHAEEYPLGTLKKDQHQRVLFEFLIDEVPESIDQVIIANGEITVKRKPKDLSVPFVLEQSIAPAEDEVTAPPEEIMRAIAHLMLYRLQEKAQKDILAGEPENAYQRLINLSSHLMAKGQQALAKVAMNEAEYIKSNHEFSPDGKKELKYQTRNLMLPG